MSPEGDGGSAANGHDYVSREEFEFAYRRIESLEAPMLGLKADSAERLVETRNLNAKMGHFVEGLHDTNKGVMALRTEVKQLTVEVQAMKLLLEQLLAAVVSKKKLKKQLKKVAQ